MTRKTGTSDLWSKAMTDDEFNELRNAVLGYLEITRAIMRTYGTLEGSWLETCKSMVDEADCRLSKAIDDLISND